VKAILGILAAYLLGATPTSYIAGRVSRGIDLREHGSKNLGATNVYRVLGWSWAIPVGLFDVLKGVIPPALFAAWADGPAWLAPALGGAAVLGHVFSPFVGFKGGKGVATAAGMFLALAPLALLIALPVWGLALWLTGYVSVASLLAAGTFPVWVRLTAPDAMPTFWAAVALATLIVVSHRANIGRLLAGTESRFRTRRSVGGES
jgi:glycerol-3-phosphate acyltransferase PlsY